MFTQACLNTETAHAAARPAEEAKGGGRADRRGRTVGAFGRDRRAATAVEFGLVAMPFFLLVLMIFQTALFHFAQQSLDLATREASRLVMTGKVPATQQSAEAFRNQLICPKLLFGLECANITARAYKIGLTSDASAGTGIYQFVDASAKALRAPTSASFCIGAASDYVFLDVSYSFTSGIAALFGLLAANGVKSLRSTSLFRNEPFSTGGATC
ncbi:hypothetical protein GCM10011390_40660 [Aureimonas endophytica]|uniref:TadE-like domain-containing protein n=1 Tax=Aureimonas endophytica TaxID=2027858 RepID=A0A916ZWZ3_9HYPH|nr:TadE/TadG family type IV pilus assembly protein [Aureimonas endophytica]GGE17423.1 hypothetical protein GCM10011390_40660 [Aureimonas endophytica]